MYIDNHFAAVEDAVEVLLLASLRTNPPPFRHLFPQKVSRDETIPILTEIDDNLEQLERISESLIQVKTQLARWKGRANAARPVGALLTEMLSDVFSHVYDDAANCIRPHIAVQLSHVSSLWRGICVTQSALWADIDNKWGYGRQNRWLERSKQQPLRIFAQTNALVLSLPLTQAIDRIDTITTSAIPGDRETDPFPDAVVLGHFPALRHISLDMKYWDRHLRAP